MRIALIALCLVSFAGGAWAQAQTDTNQTDTKKPDKSEYSTGRTVTPETKGQLQPQGWTGPINTTTGGAPAESPQGQTPPGMQAAPEGSSKTTVAHRKSATTSSGRSPPDATAFCSHAGPSTSTRSSPRCASAASTHSCSTAASARRPASRSPPVSRNRTPRAASC